MMGCIGNLPKQVTPVLIDAQIIVEDLLAVSWRRNLPTDHPQFIPIY
jgi:hypothetical protein